jgi:hypothetical protein
VITPRQAPAPRGAAREKRPLKLPDRAQIRPDQPLRLAVAAALEFPDGSLTVAGLRKERDRGRLDVEMIAGKEYTTLAAIEKMREACRVQRNPQGFTPVAAPVERPSGSSSTTGMSKSLLTARLAVEKLKKSSRNTSARKGSRSAEVIHLSSPSRTS